MLTINDPTDDRVVDHAPDRARGGAAGPSATTDPIDLPMLDEVPLLGAAMAAARRIDRDVATLLDALLTLQDDEVAETATGISLEQWLAIAGRRTASDRRMLLTACDALRRLPSLRSAFLVTADVSWAQVRAVALMVERVPRRFDDLIDGELARTIEACRGDEPDVLTQAVSRAVRSLDPEPTRATQDAAERDEFVALQPRLDGSGGRLFGDLGPLGFATVDAALTPARTNPADRTTTADDGSDRSEGGSDAASPGFGTAGRQRARRLIDLCDGVLGDASDAPGASARATSAPGADGDGAAPATAAPQGSRPQLLVRLDLDTLLDREQLPAELLTKLTGGKLWLDGATARRLADARGADLRAVVLDRTGRVVGVGRRTRIAPGWLRDATLALHDTCSHPGCQIAARRCDIDHARPWFPVHRDRPAGDTDIDQLAPVCRHHNHRKEADGWRVEQEADGTRRWHHPRSGLTTTTRPATWRAPP